MAGLPDYSTTAASNAVVGSVVWSEGQAPSTVNDSARAVMADIAAQIQLETVSGTDTYTVTYDIVPSAYSTKMPMYLLFTNANTSTTPTLNVNSLGAKTIVDKNGSALAVGAIAASSAHHAIYDGTNIRLIGAVVNAASATASGIVELATDAETVTGTDTARATTPANITAKMAAPGAIGGTTPAAGTFTSLNSTGGGSHTGTHADMGTVTTVDINGGTIDGAVIGGASAAAGTFTAVTATSASSFAAPITVTGSAGGAGGSVRYIGSGGATNTFYHNVPTGGSHYLAVNESTVARVTSTGLNECAVGASTASSGAFTTVTATSSIKSSSDTAGVGYATGAGSTVTQITNKSTGVTLNKICGTITTHDASLSGAGIVEFTVTNSAVAATDCVIVNMKDGAGSPQSYDIAAEDIAAGSFKILITNKTGGALAEAIDINFAVIKAVAA